MKVRTVKGKRVIEFKPMTFEAAMVSLRRGRMIRRRAWHVESHIFRLGPEVFVRLPKGRWANPEVWRPYSQDFLATDWEVVRG